MILISWTRGSVGDGPQSLDSHCPLIFSHLNVILFRPFYDSFQRKANCRDMSSQLEIFVRALSR
jgi:hypothetical protein